tara:strand:- start:6538 stop:6750 length:213 start_codon:yes stop_codon:yes gene_type:complete
MRFDAADPETHPTTQGPWLVRWSSESLGECVSILPWHPSPWRADGADGVWTGFGITEYVANPFTGTEETP